MAEEPGPDALDPVARARWSADEVLFPGAQDVDRSDRVPAGHLSALAGAGLFGLAGPTTHDGLDLAPRSFRRAVAAVGGGCGATFFVWVQHHGVVRTLRASENSSLVDALLTPLCRGEQLAGTAFAHVRRPGPPAVRATRVDGGWRLDGHAPWATSWGIADWFSVAAVTEAGQLLWAMVPGDRPAGITATPLDLPVFGATATVALDFDGCSVPDERVAGLVDLDDWRVADARRAALGQPAVLGVAERAVRLLREVRGGEDPEALAAADRLDDELADRWRHDDHLVTEAAAGTDVVPASARHRAEVLSLAQRCTTALLAGTGGRGMERSHPAQRLAREAAFYVIQAQTTDGRAATLAAVSSPVTGA